MKKNLFLLFAIVSVAGMIAISGCGKEKVYTVTFDANGGSGDMRPQTFVKDVSQVLISNMFKRNGYSFMGWNTIPDGTGVAYSDAQEISPTKNITFYAQWNATTGQKNGHEYVDLGLPSGRLWATCNIGANAPEVYGDYFAWGETSVKESYVYRTYKYGDTVSGYKYYKYNDTDSLVTLETTDDAATVNWGTDWRMPTYEDFYELIIYCDVEISTINGVNGYLFRGTNGSSIFMPMGGIYSTNLSSDTTIGRYWSSSRYYKYSATYLSFAKESCSIYSSADRYLGFLVRPVIM